MIRLSRPALLSIVSLCHARLPSLQLSWKLHPENVIRVALVDAATSTYDSALKES